MPEKREIEKRENNFERGTPEYLSIQILEFIEGLPEKVNPSVAVLGLEMARYRIVKKYSASLMEGI